MDFKKINENIKNGLLTDFEVTATCYDFPETTSFFKSKQPQACWEGVAYTSCSTDIHCHHLLATSAIPLFFPAIEIDNLHFGDGGVGTKSPLRSAIRLGADQILIISTRHTPPIKSTNAKGIGDITFAKELGSMLNGLFLGNLDKDLELLLKINDLVDLVPSEEQKKSNWRKIKVLYIYPSKDLGKLAEANLHAFPILFRYLMSVFGSKEQSGDLMSFLLFESLYCKQLVEIGYDDTMKQRNQIKEFFSYQ
jgi:NTE family protein